MKKENNRVLVILVLGLVVTSIILASNANKGTTTPQVNTLSASGTAQLTVAPDKAEVYIKIETIEETATESKDKNAEITDDVIKALKRKGVRKDDIETSRFDLFRKQEWNDRTRKTEFVGYQLTHVLKVTTEKLDDVGKFIDVSVDAGANGIERVSFGLTDDREKEVREEALVKASSLAKEKAKALAASLSVRLIEITSVSESGFSVVPYTFFPRAELAVEEASTSIQPQNVEISASVNLAYKIR